MSDARSELIEFHLSDRLGSKSNGVELRRVALLYNSILMPKDDDAAAEIKR